MRSWVLIVGIFLAGVVVGAHVKELLDHDELLVCRMLVNQLNGTAEQ